VCVGPDGPGLPVTVEGGLDDVDDGVGVEVGQVVAPDTPTQYQFPGQKLLTQSKLTAGFQERNCGVVTPNLVAIFPR